MSDFDRDWIDELKPERAPEKPEKASGKAKRTESRAKAAAAPAPAKDPRNEPRGKKTREGMEQVNAAVPVEVKASAFYYLKMQRKPGAPRSLSDLIEELLASWVEEQGGILGGEK